MPNGVVIFSRMGSSRLPGKALVDIGGRCLLQRVIDRAKKVDPEAVVIVATSDHEGEAPIVDCARGEGVEVFQGALDDVAGRALACAEKFGLRYFARVCGDRPFFDPEVVNEYLIWAENDDLELATNVIGKTFPPGLTTEIVKTSALARLISATQDVRDLEHVTRFFYQNSDMFNIGNRLSTHGWNDVSLVVDNEKDLDRARYIVCKLGGKPECAELPTIIKLAREWYELNP